MQNSTKHIILCTQQFGNYWSGLGAYSTHLAKGLVQSGVNVTVASPGIPPDVEGMDFISVSPSKYDPTHGGWFSLSYAYAKAIKNTKADLIHFTDARESFAYKGNIPSVGTLHDDYFARHKWNPFYYKNDYVDWIKRWAYYSFVTIMERRALRRLAGRLANSNATAKTISNAYNIPQKNIKTIYLGMDLEIVPIDEDLENKRLTNPTLLLVGGNNQRKGLPNILIALKSLIKEIPGLTLQVVGKNQNLNRMKTLANKLGVADYVEFLGWVSPENIHTYYRQASVFVMPSLMEGFGLVFLEAMAQGLPVIGGNVGGTPELIQNEENGILISPGDSAILQNAILKLLNDRNIRNKIIQNGYKTLEKFSVKNMVNDTIKYYNGILNDSIAC
ncbi:MAG: glycosyltransferase family 4 protein [Candidatus Marinimicrobia bacterium]|nr:glycosyltransferase family 4 protein [Candidatus Neomarinimicrobiota bacterium]